MVCILKAGRRKLEIYPDIYSLSRVASSEVLASPMPHHQPLYTHQEKISVFNGGGGA